ncbi:hypothetical protein ACF3MZ_27700 [Paenibacillaceae bacterium WGS1546]|uniref:hypothetical protein n=1 Tax=Cohnella sp. WGS1546 TaxID=3366810 RepID=UPI00372D3A79
MLLDIEHEVTPADTRSHLRYDFKLDRPCAGLWVRFEYSPKILEERKLATELIKRSIERYIEPERQKSALERAEQYYPLRNLITVSIDDSLGHRGACHRQDPVQELYLSEREASPGLTRGKIPEGTWTVTLSLHAIVTEQCAYRLKVWAAEAEEEFR